MSMELDFAQAYALTIAAEIVVLYCILRREHSTVAIINNAVIANTITLPFVWFFFPAMGLDYLARIVLSEIFAFAAEAAYYFFFAGVKFEKAIAASFACNLFSFAIASLA